MTAPSRLTRRAAALLPFATLPFAHRAAAHTATPPDEASPAASPAMEDPETVFTRLAELEAAADLLPLIQLAHPDSLRETPGYVIAGWYRDNPGQPAEPAGEIEAVPGWTWPGNGQTYDAYIQPQTRQLAGGETQTFERVIAPDETGRLGWFFGDTREFVQTQQKRYRDQLFQAGLQTDFQLLSFPARDIDIRADLPESWDAFTKDATGILDESASASSQYAYYVDSSGVAAGLVYSWQRFPVGDAPETAFDYGVRALVAPELDDDVRRVFLTAPDLRLDVYMADGSFARLLAPVPVPDTHNFAHDRAIYLARGESEVWFHSVTALTTDPAQSLAISFAASLPFIAQ